MLRSCRQESRGCSSPLLAMLGRRPNSCSSSRSPQQMLLITLLLCVLYSSRIEQAVTAADAGLGEAKPPASSTSLEASARALWRWKSNITMPSPSVSSLSSWRLDSGSNSSSAPCSWSGVGCSADLAGITVVTRIEIPGLGIIGRLDELEFAALPNLTYLNLSHNRLHGSIPGRDFPPQLVSLDLHDNSFSGPIPASIGNLTRLQVLDVSVNRLGSPLPPEMANLKSLLSLNLSVNSIAGGIAGANLLSTVALDLNLSATLTSLDIGWNGMTGEIPERAISALRKLRYLSLAGNQLSGGIPAAIGQQLRNLTYLSLYRCSLSGSLSNELAGLDSLELLDLAMNFFSGPIPPELGNLQKLLFLKLSYNNFTGEIPPQLGNLPALQFIKLKGNNLTGAVPAEMCGLKSLRIINLSNNMLSGGIPACIGTMSSLLVIDLRNNWLSGEIPATLCSSLPLLEVINLSNNSLTGTPPDLTQCGRLVTLDLGENRFQGPIPEWLLDSSKLSPTLRILRLTSNAFRGPIPPQLSRLQSLQYLDISKNGLTGPIPPELGDLRAMRSARDERSGDLTSAPREQYIDGVYVVWKGRTVFFREVLTLLSGIDLSGNHLSGGIPSEVTGLAGMILLNLSGNDLSGPIPPDIGGLVSMESLDLSRNSLTGAIPESLSDLNFLSALNLSDNNLSGRIPSGLQLQVQDPSAYSGNPGLCGSPLPNLCDEDDQEEAGSSPASLEKLAGNIDSEWVIWGSIPGYFVGVVLAICGRMILRKKTCESYDQQLYTNYLDNSLYNSRLPFL